LAHLQRLGLKLVSSDYVEGEGNLLTTAGANDLFTGMVTGLGTLYNGTNAQLAVGDSVTAAAVGQTDLQAAAGTKINAADPSSASNTTPIVVAGTYSPTPLVGQVYQFSAFTGAGAAAINNTFELSVASGISVTLLNSAGTGSITVTGGLIKPVNYYRQVVTGTPTVSTNTVQFNSLVGTTNANFAWQEWAICTGAGATNKQAQAPPKMFNRVVASLGTKTNATAWSLAVTVSLA
jgi:hypothetical protein